MNLKGGLKISVTASLILHLLAASALFLIQHHDAGRVKPSVVWLVTPKEMAGKKDEGTKGSGRQETKGSQQERDEHKGIKGQKGRIDEKGPGLWEPKRQGMPEGKATDSNHERSKDTASPIPSNPGTPEPSGRVSVLPRKGLFDKDIVENIAMGHKEDIKPDKGITFDTEELRYRTYMERLKERIEGIWRYPPEAAEKGIFGDLYIRFTIKKNGGLGDVELLRTSGYRSLDEAAMKALKEAEPFWPLPEEWKKDDLIITGHFIYTLYGVYLR